MQSYTYKNPLTFESITLEALNQGREGVYIRIPSTEEHYSIRKPLFLEDPDKSGFLKEVHHRKIVYGKKFILGLKNISLIGVSTFLTDSNEWFNDHCYENEEALNHELELLKDFTNPYHNGWTRFCPTPQKAVFKKSMEDRSEIFLKGKTLVLCSQEPDVFGSWIFRLLPKLNTVMQHNIHYDQILMEPHDRLMEYLDLLGIDCSKVVKHHRNFCYKLEHAVIPSLQNALLYLDAETRLFYSQLREKYGVPQKRENKFFISRLKHGSRALNYRVLKNEKELEDTLIDSGFQSIYPEQLSVQEQIKVFSSAGVIVGPSGSALFNCVYCHPGTVVIDIESQPFHLDNHAALFTSYGVNYAFLAGNPDPLDSRPVHRNWTVNVPALMKCLEKIL